MKLIAPLAALCVLTVSAGCTAAPATTTSAPAPAGTPIETTIVPTQPEAAATPVETATPVPGTTSTTSKTTTSAPATSSSTRPTSSSTTTRQETSTATSTSTVSHRPSTAGSKGTATSSQKRTSDQGGSTSARTGASGDPGTWTPSCTSASGDAKKLTDEVLLQSDLAKSTVRTSTDVLLNCPAAHALAVRAQITGTNLSARMIREGIDATLRSAPLQLSGTKVGRFPVGQTPMAEALPVLKAVLGEPDSTHKESCELSGGAWETLRWKGFTVAFDANAKGKPVNYWQITRRQGQPANLKIVNGLEVGDTLADLKKVNPGVTLDPLFGNGEYPMQATVKPGLWFIWDTKNAPSDAVIGGNLNLCD